jgi:hypothetical protein
LSYRWNLQCGVHRFETLTATDIHRFQSPRRKYAFQCLSILADGSPLEMAWRNGAQCTYQLVQSSCNSTDSSYEVLPLHVGLLSGALKRRIRVGCWHIRTVRLVAVSTPIRGTAPLVPHQGRQPMIPLENETSNTMSYDIHPLSRYAKSRSSPIDAGKGIGALKRQTQTTSLCYKQYFSQYLAC